MKICQQLYQQVILISECMSFIENAGECEILWAERFTIGTRKQEFLAVWGWVRYQLAQALNVPAKDLQFKRSKAGKPFLVAPMLEKSMQFNLTHTKNNVGFCCSNQVKACGIDIEIPRPMQDMLALAKRFYATEEFDFLRTLSIEQQQYYFFKFWVVKEAVLKASGLGMSFGLEKVVMQDGPFSEAGEITLNINGQSRVFHWQFFEMRNKPYVKALSVQV